MNGKNQLIRKVTLPDFRSGTHPSALLAPCPLLSLPNGLSPQAVGTKRHIKKAHHLTFDKEHYQNTMCDLYIKKFCDFYFTIAMESSINPE